MENEGTATPENTQKAEIPYVFEDDLGDASFGESFDDEGDNAEEGIDDVSEQSEVGDTQDPEASQEPQPEVVDAPAADTEGGTEIEETEADLIAYLRSEISRLSAEKLATPQAVAQQIAVEAETVDFDFLEGHDFDEVLTRPEAFNKCLREAVYKVLNHERNQLHAESIEKMQVALPTVIASQITHQQNLTAAANNFYSAHEALAQHKPLVASHVTSIASENPEWTLEQIMAEAATRSYKQLRLTNIVRKAETTVVKDKTAGTGLRRPTSGRTGQRTLGGKSVTELQKELDELDSINSQF